MSGSLLTLADLLAPIRPELFFERHWENEPLHIRGRASRFYEALLTHRDVEAAIASGGLRYPAIQLARDGRFLAAEAFTRGIRSGDDVFTGIPNLDRIRAEYRSGATISLPGFHRAWRPLGALAAAVEKQVDHAVHTNVYITPGNAAGFSAHYDTHEVFVLQIAGSKRWQIDKPLLPLPHRGQPFDPRGNRRSVPFLKVDLAPGDLLYLPRGFVHATTTSDSFSVHVTLGITVYTWVELLAEWVQSCKHHPSSRRALPAGFAGRGDIRQSLKQQLPLMVAELARLTDYDRLVDDFAHRVRLARADSQSDFSVDVIAVTPQSPRA